MNSKAVLMTNKRKLLKYSLDTSYILYSHFKDSDIIFLFLINKKSIVLITFDLLIIIVINNYLLD